MAVPPWIRRKTPCALIGFLSTAWEYHDIRRMFDRLSRALLRGETEFDVRALPPRIAKSGTRRSSEGHCQMTLSNASKLRSQHDDTGPCIDRQPRVLFVRHDRAQFVDPGVALRRNQPELGQMRPQGVDDLGALAYQHIARAMLHQLTLLFGRFDPHE